MERADLGKTLGFFCGARRILRSCVLADYVAVSLFQYSGPLRLAFFDLVRAGCWSLLVGGDFGAL